MRFRPMRGELAFAVLCFIGCGSFGEGATPTTTETPDDGGSPNDAGVPTADGPVADASAPPVDAGPEEDGGDVLGTNCSALFFCDDFEHIDAQGPWSERVVSAGSSINTTTTRSKNGAYSAVVNLPQYGLVGREASLAKTLDGNARRVVLAFHLYVTTHPQGFDAAIAEIETATGHVLVSLRSPNVLALSSEALGPAEPGANADTTIEEDVWHTIVLDYNASASPTASLNVVGRSKLEIPVTKGGGDATVVRIGCTYASGGVGADYYLDDAKIARVRR